MVQLAREEKDKGDGTLLFLLHVLIIAFYLEEAPNKIKSARKCKIRQYILNTNSYTSQKEFPMGAVACSATMDNKCSHKLNFELVSNKYFQRNINIVKRICILNEHNTNMFSQPLNRVITG